MQTPTPTTTRIPELVHCEAVRSVLVKAQPLGVQHRRHGRRAAGRGALGQCAQCGHLVDDDGGDKAVLRGMRRVDGAERVRQSGWRNEVERWGGRRVKAEREAWSLR